LKDNFYSNPFEDFEPDKTSPQNINIQDDSNIRREYPIESVLHADIDIHTSKTVKEEKSPSLIPNLVPKSSK
jgi:hypothetical protein